MDAFEVATASVVGRDHALAGRNNQDAVAWWRGPELLLAAVADGCGSSRASELGALLGARLLVAGLRKQAYRLGRDPMEEVLESVRVWLLERLRLLAGEMGGPLGGAVTDFLLFTLVGAAVTPQVSFLFVCGDGVLAVNGRTEVLTFADNAPPYLAYALTGRTQVAGQAGAPRFEVRHVVPTAEVSSLLIGTDGVADLVAHGPVDWLWEDDRHFQNPQGLARRLRLLSRPTERIDWVGRRVERQRAVLGDDATVAVIRRARAAS
jgi:hypothetical protein